MSLEEDSAQYYVAQIFLSLYVERYLIAVMFYEKTAAFSSRDTHGGTLYFSELDNATFSSILNSGHKKSNYTMCNCFILFVPRTGIEPALPCDNQILSLARLPIPPSGLFKAERLRLNA
jgi:hypothetical protein